MPQIINIPQRKTIRRGQPTNQVVIPEYKIVSEPEYSSNGEKLIIAKDINQTIITLDSTKNTKVIVKVLTSVRVLPDIGKIDEEWDELQLDWGACVQFHYVEGNWYILSSDGLKMS
jgi:hypothetical protein